MALFIELLLIGIGLAMDAFAVSICKGLAMRKVDKKQALVIALFFGGFQALMPFIGWLISNNFTKYITNIDHWIAFILLTIIGGNMIVSAISEKDDIITVDKMDQPLDIKELTLLAIATSIDALAIGISFALLDTPIVPAVAIVGIVTFIICIIGVYIGNFFGNKYKSRAELIGGIILVVIGLKILLEHLGIVIF